MKKIILFGALFALLSQPVLADWGMMDGTGMMGTGMGLVGLVYFAVGAFIFSVIFWLTHNWLVPKRKK
jgi:hypothetical protein